MNIDKYFKEDGYYDENDCFYEDAESFIQTGILHHCGCGSPETSLRYLKGALRLIYNIYKSDFEKAFKELDSYFHSKGEKYTICYMLDALDLTEHGTSVPGWLTEKGIELLEDLECLYPDTVEEDCGKWER